MFQPNHGFGLSKQIWWFFGAAVVYAVGGVVDPAIYEGGETAGFVIGIATVATLVYLMRRRKNLKP